MKRIKRIFTVVLLLTVLVVPVTFLTACDESEETEGPVDGYYVEKTERYYLDELSTVVLDLPLGILFDPYESYFEFRPDGTMKIRAMIKSTFLLNISSMLDKYGIDLSKVNLQSTVDTYVVELMPSFTLKDIPFSLRLLDATLGIKVLGFDTEYKGIRELCDALYENASLPSVLDLPAGLGLEYEGTYVMKDLTSVTTGKVYRAAFTGGSAENGEPYGVMTFGENEEGKKTVDLHVEFIKADVVGVAL